MNNEITPRQELEPAAQKPRRRRRQKPRTLEIGSISSGTLRLEDLIPSLLWELSRLRLTRFERLEIREIQSHQNRTEDPEGDWDRQEELDWDYQSLTEIADNHTPDYCYFGSTEGDGAEIGVWPSTELLRDHAGHDHDVYRSSETPGTPATPADYDSDDPYRRRIARQDHAYALAEYRKVCRGHTYWLHVNDHGNATLYRRSGRTWREIWSVV